MNKLLIFSLFACSVAQLNAMDKEIEKEKKQEESISESVFIQDAGNPFADCMAKIKVLEQRYRRLAKKYRDQAEQIKKLKNDQADLLRNQTISHDNKVLLEKRIEVLEYKLQPKPKSCTIPNCKCSFR